jgi:integrase
MPTVFLKAEFVERAKPSSRLIEIRDAKSPGLALRITPSGSKSWTLRYRLASGRQRRISLGRYPAVSLAKARDRALATLTAVAEDRDPAEEKRHERASAQRARLDTLGVLADRYFTDAVKGRHRHGGRSKRPSTLALERYYWTKHVKPAFGGRAIRTITRAEIQTFVNGFSAPSTARQCRVVFQRLFAFALWLELVDTDPTRFVHVDHFKARDRVLTDEELRAIWEAFDAPDTIPGISVSSAVSIAVRLSALTLQRRAEIAGIDIREIDFGASTWTIPADRTKNHRVHVVPLSASALGLMEQALNGRPKDAKGPLFPSPRQPSPRHLSRSISPNAITHAFLRVCSALGLLNASPHDLRRTGATALTSERIGIQRFIVSRVLNHASDTGDAAAVTAVYDRHAYLPEKRRALDAWAALLAEIVAGKTRPTNVVRVAG